MLKNIIFDFGGVLIKLDYNRTLDAFEALGIINIRQYFSQMQQTDLFNNFDKGKITPEEFRGHFNRLFNIKLAPEEFDKAWNTMLLDIPKENIDFLNKAKESYHTFLLSNTNEIHINAINKYLNQKHSITNWKNYFNNVYYSFEKGMRKPDKEFFEKIINENNLIPEETLFVEDNDKNLEAGEKAGLQIYPFPFNGNLPHALAYLLE